MTAVVAARRPAREPRSALARVRRATFAYATGFPFEGRSERRLLIHCAHHKVGTVWFKNVLGRVAAMYGLSFQMSRHGLPVPRVGLMVVNGSRIDLASLPPYRGSHMVRDPRDVAVSGYFYHRRCSEPAVLAPNERFGGRSYQEYLQSAGQEDGLAAEIELYTAGVCRAMAAWDYTRTEFLELRYEDFLADEATHWERLFRHYRFREQPARRAARLAGAFSINSEAYRQRRSAHVRSGRSGDWRAYFTGRHRELFHQQCGDILVRLGYERDDRW